MTKIVQSWKSDRLTHKTAQHIFRVVLQEFLSHLRLVDTKDHARISSHYKSSTILQSTDVIGIIRQCVALDLEPQIHQLLGKLEKLASEEEPATAFAGFFLPFAKDLNGVFNDQDSSALAQKVQDMGNVLAEKLIELYPALCVGPKPLPPRDWRRTKAGCGCTECFDLDTFLVDPVQEKIQISVKSEERLRHLKNRLPTIDTDDWNRRIPEHDSNAKTTDSTFTLSICKTQFRWTHEVRLWEQDRDAAIKIFGDNFDDKDLQKALEARIEELGRVAGGDGNNAIQVGT